MKSTLLAFAFCLVLALSIISNVSALTYEATTFVEDSGSSPQSVMGLSHKTTNECNMTLGGVANLTGNNFDVFTTFMSPDNVTIATGTLTGQTNISCKNLGSTSTTDDLNDYYEGKMEIIHTALSGKTILSNFISCEQSAYWYNILVDATSETDSHGNVPDRFGFNVTGYLSNTTVIGSTYPFDSCNSELSSSQYYLDSGSGTGGVFTNFDRTIYGIYPINTSAGRITYSFDLGNATNPILHCAEVCVGGTFYGDTSLFLVDVEDESYITLHHDSITCEATIEEDIYGTYAGTLEGLDEDTLYMLVFVTRYEDPSATSACFRQWQISEPFNFNISAYIYRADWVCGAWSECIDTSQTRTCIDANGISPDKIEYRTCALGIIENATLGFENFITISNILKCEPQWIFGCVYNIANIAADRPANWSIVDPAYGAANFLQMTQEYATEGTRSLKMWQIPPKQGEVIDNTTCGNLTTSIIPQIFQGVSNNTFSVSHNVTFPAENMQISFDVKRCQSQVLQHSAIVPLSWGNISLLTLCDEVCYSESCYIPPNGAYVFNIVDTNTSQSIFGVPQFADAQPQTLSPTYDISNLGIVPGRTYNIVFALSNENPNDATGNCIYFDNVRYAVTELSFLEFVPNCESRCFDSTRIEATRTESGSCFIVTQEDSPLCVDDTTANAIENQEDFCRDETTLRTFNEKTGKYESIDCSETGNVCFNGRCQSEEEVTGISTSPTTDTQGFLSWFNWLFSPLFIFLIITLILGGLVSKATTSGNKDGKGSFEVFGAVIIIMMIIGTLPGIAIIPVWVAIAIIVIVSLMVAQVMGIFAGRG